MFRLIGRAGYRVAWHLRKVWLRVRGGTIRGCMVIALDDQGRVLLVRHSYGTGHWAFPGGGRGRNENPEHAARREFAEELGCALGDLSWLGQSRVNHHGATNELDVFAGPVAGTPRPDGIELVEARFFARDDLPQPLSRSVAREISRLP